LVRRHVLVVRIPGGHFQSDVGGDDGWVVAERFKEDELYTPFLRYTRFDARPVVDR
jgi:predicted methyltransferase MtxX (methanogen marker protein 4)